MSLRLLPTSRTAFKRTSAALSRQKSTNVDRKSRMNLPRLPVPDLRRTLDRYIQSLKPFLLEDEARGGPSYESALERRVHWAREFEEGVGAVAQDRLIQLDKSSPHNWLDDNIWLKKAYHEWRAPLLINSNWWLAFFNDSTIPDEVINGSPTSINPWQVRRAAWMIHRVLDLKDKLAQQELYPQTTRSGVWFRDSVSRFFGVCRIPKPGCDTLSPLPPSSSADARKVLIMAHDWFYTLEVYDESWKAHSAEEIERRLSQIVRDVSGRIDAGEVATPVGVLSADDRDDWAKNLGHLLSLSPKNERIYQAVQHSLFALSLDNWTLGASPGTTSTPAVDSLEEVDHHLSNIRSSRHARNRWFDKAYTLVVETNTRAGAMGEHSPVDALVPSMVAEYAIVQEIDASFFSDPVPKLASHDSGGKTGFERLDWVVDEHIAQECRAADTRARSLIADSDDGVLWFKDYGTDWIRNTAQLPPDAYLQMALQLAWYRTRGSFTATYETVLTRIFDHGRTETLRTLTVDSRAWVLAMADPSTSLAQRLELLRRAIQTHARLTREAATGKGIDRHLLGLRVMLREGEGCDLFNDELFAQSQEWKLSTSGLSAGPLFRGTGFGASYTDGYGINYIAGPDIVKFGIESKHSNPLTSTRQFQAVIAEVLHEMQHLCLFTPSPADHPTRAHL
ncbi:acyltransferase ChoActase/COT/CPT [Dentipellis sp. KUC8613]|nr:acyltransferase ChoActase/COT/CPT [Dentipellis sp. KUC8613]